MMNMCIKPRVQQTYNALGAASSVQGRQPSTVFRINTSSIQQQQLGNLGFAAERCSMQCTSLLTVLHNVTI